VSAILTKNSGTGIIPLSDIVFQELTEVLPNTLTDIFTYTNITGKPLYLLAIGGECNARSQWHFYLAGDLKLKRRNSISDMNVEVGLNSFRIGDGETVVITAEHFAEDNADFAVDMRYYQ